MLWRFKSSTKTITRSYAVALSDYILIPQILVRTMLALQAPLLGRLLLVRRSYQMKPTTIKCSAAIMLKISIVNNKLSC